MSKPYAVDTIPWVEPARVDYARLYPSFPREVYRGQSNPQSLMPFSSASNRADPGLGKLTITCWLIHSWGGFIPIHHSISLKVVPQNNAPSIHKKHLEAQNTGS